MDLNDLRKKIESFPVATVTAGDSSRLNLHYVGHECPRAKWLAFRNASSKQIDFRTSRVFERAQIEKIRIPVILEAAGIKIIAKQVQCSNDELLGYADAIIMDVPIDSLPGDVILIVRTADVANWKKVATSDVLSGKFEHYAYTQFCMGLLQREQALYFCVNKNTEEMYIEYLSFDRVFFERKREEISRVLALTEPPQKKRLRNVCGYCDFLGVCWIGEELRKHCRTCQNASRNNENWFCRFGNSNKELSFTAQMRGCSEYIRMKID